jgi:glycosyltransferase involved in cell wall biosynthesis
MNRGFSIILCCYNSAALLPETLKSLAALEISPGLPVELLVIDNASADRTAAVAMDSWVRYGEPFPLTIFREPRAGLSFARKAGIRLAGYEYLLFCDDDNRLDPDYLTGAEKY